MTVSVSTALIILGLILLAGAALILGAMVAAGAREDRELRAECDMFNALEDFRRGGRA